MNTILRHIEYLLTDHDCVVIPGLGAVLATKTPAQFDEVEGTYYAPSRRYTFNSSLTESDGVLIMSIARSLGIDYQSAARRVETAVNDLKIELSQSGEITLGRIGRLETGNENTVSFTPFNTDLITPLAGWIGNVVLAAGEAVADSHHHNSAGVKPIRPSRFSRYVRTAVGAVAAILIAIVVSTPIPVKNTYKASMALPEVSAPKPAEIPELQISSELHEPAEISTATTETAEAEPAPAPAVIEIAQSETKQSSLSEMPRFDESDSFGVIVASLASEADAEKYITQYSRKVPGLTFGTVTNGSHHRVYVATGSTKAEAQQQTHNPIIVKNFEGAWVTTL